MDELGSSTQNRSEEAGPGVTETVQQVASSAADSIQGVASSVADTAQDAVSGVVDKVQDVTGAVADQANRVTEAAASQVETLADTVYQQAATPGAPALQRNVAETTVNVLDRTAEYLRQGDLSLVLEDLRSAIRRNPGRSLLLGLTLGYFARSTFFGGGSTQSQSVTGRTQPFTPRAQAVPVYGENMGVGIDATYPTPGASGSTLSSDMGLGADLDISQSTLATSSGLTAGTTSIGGLGDTGLDAYGTTTGSTSMAGGLSDVGTLGSTGGLSDTGSLGSGLADTGSFGSAIGTGSTSLGSDFGTLNAPSDTGSVMGDDLAAGATLDADDVFVASTDATDQELTDETRMLGGEDLRSDITSTDTMPSDDLLSRWDAETRDRTGEA